MKIRNKQIYEYAQKLSIFSNFNLTMPVRISFYLQKNIRLIQEANDDIERARLQIGARFGTINETQTGYDIPREKMSEVNAELNELFELEQDIPIHIFKLEDFDGIDLSYQELSAIMFMIEE